MATAPTNTPSLDAVNFPIFMAALTPRQAADFQLLIGLYADGLANGSIPNVVYQESKSDLGRMVAQGWDKVVGALLPPGRLGEKSQTVQDLYFDLGTSSLHACKSSLKRVRACAISDPLVIAMRAFLEEVEPLVTANETLKGMAVKRMPKTAEQRAAENVFVPPPGSTEATARVHQMLVEVTDLERENIVSWLTTWYRNLANNYFGAGPDGAAATYERQRELYRQPEYRAIVHACQKPVTGYQQRPVAVRADGWETKVAEIAEGEAKQIQEQFVFKNIKKIAAIIEAKGNFDRGEVVGHRVHLSGLTGSMRFFFTDGSHFKVENSVVGATSSRGLHFSRYPLTFHDVTFANGEKMKSPCEERMYALFVKQTQVDEPVRDDMDVVQEVDEAECCAPGQK